MEGFIVQTNINFVGKRKALLDVNGQIVVKCTYERREKLYQTQALLPTKMGGKSLLKFFRTIVILIMKIIIVY